MSQPQVSEPTPPPQRAWLRWICAVGFAVLSFWMFTRDQDFPYYYHTDEPAKVDQVVRGVYDFHHPLLLLDATETLIKVTGTPLKSQPVVERGRQASAFFAAASVAAIVLLAWQLGGAAAGLLAGALTTSHPMLFELSHYMKEDCALLVGTTWTATALGFYGARPSLWRALLVGLAAGLAVSGKYMGLVIAMTALLAIGLTIARPRPGECRALLGRLAAILVAMILGLLPMAACLLALKHIGFITAIVALLATTAVIAGSIFFLRRRPVRCWAGTLAAVLAITLPTSLVMFSCFAAFNFRGLANIDKVSESFSEELEKVEIRGEQRPEAIKFKHLSKLGTSLSVPLLLGMGYWMIRRWRERDSIVWRVLGAFVVGYFFIVSLSPKTKDRYLLPIYVFGCGLGAAGMVEWTRRQSPVARRRWIGPAVAATALAWHGPELVATWKGFTYDDRRELTAWLGAHVPPNAGIAHDIRAHLLRGQESGLPGYVLPNPLYAPAERYVADVGSVDELRARGVTHVVLCEADYHSALESGSDSRKRLFYEEFLHGKLKDKCVWEKPSGTLLYFQPGFRVYQIQ